LYFDFRSIINRGQLKNDFFQNGTLSNHFQVKFYKRIYSKKKNKIWIKIIIEKMQLNWHQNVHIYAGRFIFAKIKGANPLKLLRSN